jgi:hypothetical protein
MNSKIWIGNFENIYAEYKQLAEKYNILNRLTFWDLRFSGILRGVLW